MTHDCTSVPLVQTATIFLDREDMINIAPLLSLAISYTFVRPVNSFIPACSRSCDRLEERCGRSSTSEHRCCATGDYPLVEPLRNAPDTRFVGSRTAWDRRRSRPRSQWLWSLLAMSSVTQEETQDFMQETEIPSGSSLRAQDPHIQAFEDWTMQQGFRGDVEHADFEGLRGIMAKGGVEPWKPIATVPASLLLLQEYSMANRGTTSFPPPEPLSTDVWQRCPWWVRLGVRLLKEKCAGKDSSLREYIGILPQWGENGIPLNWSTEQLKRLHYPRLLSQIALQRRLIKGFQRLLLEDVNVATDWSYGEKDRALVEALGDLNVFSWALECVLSRAFQLPPDGAMAPVLEEGGDVAMQAPTLEPPAPENARMALLPLIDSMNHYGRMPTHMYWEDDGAISLAVGARLDPGDHAFLSYGPVSNDDLLQYYGFVERDNPSDTYVLQDMGKWLREEGFLGAGVSSKFLACLGARETWRYLRRGVILRDAIHPSTLKGVRVVCCEDSTYLKEKADAESGPWDGTEADLERFASPVSLASELAVLELLMRYSAREADSWAENGVAAASAQDPTAPGLDTDLDGLGLDADRRLMLSVFRQEKLMLLRSIVSRLTHMRKVSDMLNRPIKMPVVGSPPPVLGVPMLRNARATGEL